MRNIILVAFMMAISGQAFALKAGDYSTHLGAGVFGSRGLFGLSLDYFATDHHVVSGAVGVDFIGAVSTVGYKYFSDAKPKTDSAWDKCFFFIDCDTYYYAGPSLQYAGGTTTTFTESNGDVRKYETNDKVLALLAFGTRNQFKNNVTIDAELSYRSILSGGKSTQTEGAVGDDRRSLELGYRSIGASLAVGYVF